MRKRDIMEKAGGRRQEFSGTRCAGQHAAGLRYEEEEEEEEVFCLLA